MSDNDFMGFRCTFHVRPEALIRREHNIRDSKLIKYEKHIDQSKYSETTLDLGTLDEAYKTIFGASLEEYNKRRRKDRRIKNYLEEVIRTDKRRGKHKNQKADASRKAAYEAYITIGNRDNQPEHEKSLKVLKLFVEKWIPEHYPQIRPICISYHADEFSLDDKTGERIYSAPHCHFDYVYIANALTPEEQKEEKKYRAEQKEKMIEECKAKGVPFDEKAWQKKDWQEDLVRRTGKSLTTGLSIQNSMSGALAQMGFKTGNGKHTAQIQFEERVRHDLEDFAESMGLKIDRTPGVRHSHAEKNVYQQKKDNERKEIELNDRESSIKIGEEDISNRLSNVIIKECDLAKREAFNLEHEEKLARDKADNERMKDKLDATESYLEGEKANLQQREQEVVNQAIINIEDKKSNEQLSRTLKREKQKMDYERSHLDSKIQLQKVYQEDFEREKLQVRSKGWDLEVEAKKLEKLRKELEAEERYLQSKKQNLEEDKKSLESDKKRFNDNSRLVTYYECISTHIELNTKSVDKAVEEFKIDRDVFSFRECFTKFVDKVKEIVSAISMKLDKYVTAFKNFWKWTPTHFRNLADNMEQANCNTFEDYYNRSLTGNVRTSEAVVPVIPIVKKEANHINKNHYDGLSR